MADKHTPTVLTIAGFDPSGGAGIQADIKTIHTLGGYALSAVTAITAQNSQGVRAVEAVAPELLRAQLETLLDDIEVDAVKIGMLANAELVEVVAEVIKKYSLKNIVLDTVLISSSGKRLLAEDAVETMRNILFPIIDIITPNLHEANTLLQTKYTGKKEHMPKMLGLLGKIAPKSVLLKGGHSLEKEAVDYLISDSQLYTFAMPKIETLHTHGTGCILSSAIATHIAHGHDIPSAVELSKTFLHLQMQQADKNIKLRYIFENDTASKSII